MTSKKLDFKLGISIGDINGIGAEVILKTFSDSRMLKSITPIVFASKHIIKYHAQELGLKALKFNFIKNLEDAKRKQLNVINLWEEEVPINLGKPEEIAGKYAFKSLEAATRTIAGNKIDALVTAPINKKTISSSQFPFPGHTEYLASFANTDQYLMILVSRSLRVGVVTGHIPLEEVKQKISSKLIVEKSKIM